MEYIVTCTDTVNGMTYRNTYPSIFTAVNYLMVSVFNTTKNKDWFDKNTSQLFIEEYDGKLYNHWIYREYNEYSQLFKEYDDSKPRTLLELEKYLKNGNVLVTNWSERAPVEYQIIAD